MERTSHVARGTLGVMVCHDPQCADTTHMPAADPNPECGVDPSIGLPLAALATSAIIRYRFVQTNEQVDQWRAQQQAAEDAPQLVEMEA